MKVKRTAIAGALLFALFGSVWGESSVTSPLGAAFKVPNLLVKEQTRVVLYREVVSAQSPKGRDGAASLFVNGAYQASLQRGAFTEFCMAPGQVQVAARFVQNGVEVSDALDVKNTLTLPPGEEVFVRVLEDQDGHAVMRVMPPERALHELVKTLRQVHTVSRVQGVLNCQDRSKSDAAPVVAKTMRRITLSADALFEFGKSDIESISPRGRRLLDHLVDRIKSEFGSGKDVQILVVGHADRFGSEAGNMRISKERASTIKSYFVRGGLLEGSITTDGRGDKEPVVTSCGVEYTRANVSCNKPNRRVELEVRTNKQLTNEAVTN